MKKNRPATFVVVLVLLILLMFDKTSLLKGDHLSTIPENSSFEVHYIDVGQADCSLIVCDGKYMLIDGGNVDDSSLVYSYLKKMNIEKLDYIICTHPHEDHVGGLAGALNYATADFAYCPVTEYDSKAFNNFLKALDKRYLQITVPSHGDSFYLGTALVQVIAPLDEYKEVNDNSIVLKISYGETSFLFMGDAMKESVDDILESSQDIYCTVLKLGHHGSNTSTPYQFLYNAQPKYAVIPCGENNSYGLPDEEVLSRLKDADVEVLRTDKNGTIIFESDGKNVNYKVEKGG